MRRNAVVISLLFLMATIASAQTGYIRQFARDKPKVVFIAAGSESNIQAHRLREQVLSHPENIHKRNEVTVVSVEDAADWLSRLEPNEHASAIVMLTEKELKKPLPNDVAKLLPKTLNPLKGQTSFVQSEMIKPAKHGLAFSVVLYAPDGKRLEWLCQEFAQRSFGNWREMPFATEFESDRIAMFTQAHMKPLSNTWGEPKQWNVWRDLAWYPMERRDLVLPEELENRDEVYFIDRGNPATTPPHLQDQLKDLSETSMQVSSATHDGRRTIVFSAPSRLLLQKLADRFPNLRKLPENSYRVEAVDLRTLDKALLVVPSENIDPYAAEKVHAGLLKPFASYTGQPLHPPLADGAPHEVPLQMLVGNSEDALAFRKSLSLRYAWVYVPDEPRTSMSYRTYETRHTQDPGAFTESEPSEPSRDRKTKEEYEKAMERYRREHEEWCERKSKWEYERENMAVNWTRTLERDTTVTTSGHLRLLDLSQQGKVVWEAKVHGSASETGEVLERDSLIVRGFDHVPSALARPDRDARPAVKLIIDANIAAGVSGVRRLQAEAWLPEPRSDVQELPEVRKSDGL